MFNFFTFSLVVFTSLICIQHTAAKDAHLRPKTRCTEERMNNIDLATNRLMSFGQYGRPFPDTVEKLKEYCDEGTQLIAQVESFLKECVRKRVADITMIVLYSLRSSFIRKYCGVAKQNRKEVLQLFKMAPCFNEHLLRDDECLVQFMNETTPLVNIKEDHLKVPHTCCNYVKALKCIDAKIDKQQCLQENRDPILDIIRGIFASTSDVLCGDFNEYTDSCEKLGLVPAPVTPNTKHYGSFLFVVTDVLASSKMLGMIAKQFEDHYRGH